MRMCATCSQQASPAPAELDDEHLEAALIDAVTRYLLADPV